MSSAELLCKGGEPVKIPDGVRFAGGATTLNAYASGDEIDTLTIGDASNASNSYPTLNSRYNWIQIGRAVMWDLYISFNTDAGGVTPGAALAIHGRNSNHTEAFIAAGGSVIANQYAFQLTNGRMPFTTVDPGPSRLNLFSVRNNLAIKTDKRLPITDADMIIDTQVAFQVSGITHLPS
jgi:hypothetical protein